MVNPGSSARIQDSDRTWEALLRISEEAHSATNIEDFVASIHAILSELVIADNFFIGLYEESSNKYSFHILKMNRIT